MTASNSRHSDALLVLTGLSDSELADVLAANPRAYMAVKGAVAEKHLENILEGLKSRGQIASFRQGKGDFEKDFYFTPIRGKRELVIECKNVEVIKETTRDSKLTYFQFLLEKGYLNAEAVVRLKALMSLSKISANDLESFKRSLPVQLRESSLARYEFSASSLKTALKLGKGTTRDFLRQFDENPLSIDFQRTRNSTEAEGEHPKARRFYKVGELDIVAACLFTRTLKWEFIYCKAKNLLRHETFKNRYTNRLRLKPEFWVSSLLDAI